MIEHEIVVHGKWIRDDDDMPGYHFCSKCGQAVSDECVPWFKFCPNCGARMGGDAHGV